MRQRHGSAWTLTYGTRGVASFHFSAQIIGRTSGRSAIAAAAYRAGARLRDERSGQAHDYARRRGVEHCEIMLPEGAAPWLADRQRLWNHVQNIEKRRDAQLAREINVALPHEISADERRELLTGFVREQFVARGMVADLAIHAPTDGDKRNHHAHIMLTLRQATADGLRRVKTREWNSDQLLTEWREAWARAQNRVLARGQHLDRVDHRSLAAQRDDALVAGDRRRAREFDRAPEIHIGPQAQQAAGRPMPPHSRTKRQSMARPTDGRWRSSAQSDKRQRTIDYRRIDNGTRLAFNAKRVQSGSTRVQEDVRRARERSARLRLIEHRYGRMMRETEQSLRDYRPGRKGAVSGVRATRPGLKRSAPC